MEKQAGLSDLGVSMVSLEIQRRIAPAVGMLGQREDIRSKAGEFAEEIRYDLEHGTVAVSLSIEERDQFFELLEGVGVRLNPFHRIATRTKIVG